MNDVNEIKKELMRNKVNAKFSHYVCGNLYYTVELSNGTYQFPIETVVENLSQIDEEKGFHGCLDLSDDLGTTSFHNEMRGSELSRWIQKAINNNVFIKVG